MCTTIELNRRSTVTTLHTLIREGVGCGGGSVWFMGSGQASIKIEPMASTLKRKEKKKVNGQSQLPWWDKTLGCLVLVLGGLSFYGSRAGADLTTKSPGHYHDTPGENGSLATRIDQFYWHDSVLAGDQQWRAYSMKHNVECEHKAITFPLYPGYLTLKFEVYVANIASCNMSKPVLCLIPNAKSDNIFTKNRESSIICLMAWLKPITQR